jgi:hypothetical protein
VVWTSKKKSKSTLSARRAWIFLRPKGDVITEGMVALRYTVVKQRKGADLNEGKFEELVDPVAVYPWGCFGGACLLLFCGMRYRKLRHYFQPY